VAEIKKMCPYIEGKQISKYSQTNKVGDDGQNLGYYYTATTNFVPLPCAEELCGAWQDGKCCYKGR